MFAFEIPGFRHSLPAGGAVARHRFVSVSNETAIQATNTTPVIGVSMNLVTAEEFAANDRIVEIADGILMVEAGGVIASGAKVASDAEGKAIAYVKDTTGDACGVAITAATAAGQLIAVKL